MKRSRTTLLLVLALLLSVLAVAPSSRAETDDFTLTVNTVGNGTVSVTPDPPYSENQKVTLTAVPDAGWKLASWTSGEDTSWHDGERDFRVPVTVGANGFARKDKPADVEVNFQQILNGLGGGTFNAGSVRVVEVDGNGALVDDDVPSQFAVKKTLNNNWQGNGLCATDLPGQGTVTFIMEGNTGAGVTRHYQVYFDKTGKTVTPPSVTDLVTLTDGVMDEQQSSVKVETPIATYFYHKQGAGFSSVNDKGGNDWVSYNQALDAAGKFRGIPNAVHPTNGGDLHPGDKDSSTCVLNDGPIKATIYSNRLQTQTRWNHTWDFYPNYVRHTINQARFDYYWLYEGTPGGSLDVNKDFVVFSDGIQIKAGETRELDIPGDEWGFVADPDVGRAIYLIKEEGDDKVDSYRDLDDLMTVFAFGRNLASKANLPSATVPVHFTFGLMDETTLVGATPIVNNAFKPLTVTPAAGEKRSGATLGSDNPLQFTITGNDVVTATFVKEQFSLDVSVVGAGSVTKSPDKPAYEYNEVVQLTAVPGNGATFTGWSGDASGTTNPLQVTMTGNKAITATFATGFTVQTSVTGQGTVELDPPGGSYPTGTMIMVTAVPAPGWQFSNWSGNLVGTNNPQSITVGANLSITANFVQGEYTLAVNAGPNGSVNWFPKKSTYLGGEEVTVAATPADGYTFDGWTGDLVSDKSTETVTMVKDTVITATFKAAVFYPLSITTVGQGAVNRTPNAAQYPEGTTVALEAVPATNWAFVGWSGAASGTTNPAQVLMNGPKSVTATFQQTAYAVNVTIVGDGSIVKEPNKGSYAPGEVVTITATAADDWTFSGWSGTETGTTNPLVVTVNSDENITATFVGPLTLETKVQGSGSVQVVPEKAIYTPGEQVVLTAVPDDGWLFAGWTGDLTSTQNPAQIVMNKAKVITAVFVEPGVMVSDNFDRCSLGSDPWTFINPLNDATATTNGAQLRIVVPATADHNVWKDGNNAPRVMQRANDANFDLRARFQSNVTETFQMQGMIIEQDAGKYVRVDFSATADGQDTLFAYGFDPPLANPKKLMDLDVADGDVMELRVSRNVNTDRFTVSYRLNSDTDWTTAGTFTFDLAVKKVGLFAGNTKPKNGTTPAHTAIVDYFYNAADGVEPEDTPLLTVSTIGSGSVPRSPSGPLYACGTQVTLTPKPAIGWVFDGWSGDLSGSQSPVTVTVNGPKSIIATFVGGGQQFNLLPMIIR